MENQRIIRHRSLPISAPACFWSALGWQLYSNSDVAGNHPIHNIDTYLARGIADGLIGQQCLSWAIAEQTKDYQSSNAVCAVNNEARAIQSLANSLRDESDSSVLQRIMGRLSERTQYAVRQQLRGSGWNC